MRYLIPTAALLLAACGGGGDSQPTKSAEQAQFEALGAQCQAGTASACDQAIAMAPPDAVAAAQAQLTSQGKDAKKQPEIVAILIMGPIWFPYPGPVGTGTHTVPY